MYLIVNKTGITKTIARWLLAVFCILVSSITKLGAQNINVPNKNGPLGTEVNTLSGNLFIPRNEFFVPARGIDIGITFYYNSFSYNQNNGFGNGWSFEYGMSYMQDSVGNVTIVQGDGRTDTYLISKGTFISPTGIFDVLTQYESGKYLLQTKYGLQYYFDNSTSKRLTKIENPNGNYLSFEYNDTLPISITNAAGQTITLNYNKGYLSSIVDAMATPTRTVTYAYDGSGNLTQVTDPLGNSMKYGYLVNGPISSITDKNNNKVDVVYYPNFTVSEVIGCNTRQSFSYDTTSHQTVVTDYVPTATNQVTTYTYQVTNNLAWLTKITGNCCGYNMVYAFDASGNVIQSTDANGNVYTYTYDSKGNMLTRTDPLGHTSAYTYSTDYNLVTGFTDFNGNTYTVAYDTKGNLTKIVSPGNLTEAAAYSSVGDIVSLTDAKGNKYSFTYDAYGNPTQLSGPLNYTLGTAFNARGNLLSIKDPNGNNYALQYDALDRLTTVADPLSHNMTYAYDANGNITAMTDQSGHTTKSAYDASDRLVAATDAAGEKVLFNYDAMGNLVQYTDALGNKTTFTYDSRNRIIGAINAFGYSYTFAYDNNGNLISAALPNGNTINNVYDKLDRQTSWSDNSGLLASAVYDNNGNVTNYTNATGATTSASYDGNNQLVSVTDPLGNSKTFTYDNNYNLVSLKDRNGKTATITYDALNRPTSYIDYNGNKVSATYDAASNVLTFSDQNGNKTLYTYDVLNRTNGMQYPDGKTMKLGYDNVSNVTAVQTPDGSNISYQYDSVNRLVGKTLPGNNTFKYVYDAAGRLTSAADNAGTTAFTYDAINRSVSETFNKHTTSFSYNVPSRVMQITYPDGSVVTRTFDTRGRLIGIVRGSATVASYQYNNVGQVQQATFGNSVISNMEYDFANRLSNISTSNGNIQNNTYAYDNEMNKTSVSRANFPNASEQFTYDANYRIIGYKQGVTNSSYTYDAVGNRTAASINGTSVTYSPNDLNQYASYNNGKEVNLTYDNNGNLTYDGTYYKTYDAEGRILSDSSAGNKVVYVYDALGRRVQKIINGNGINYYYAGLAQLEQRSTKTDTLLNETVYSGALSPVFANSNHKSYYYHQNDLNSVEAITDSAGNLVERYLYDAYGKPVIYDAKNNVLANSLAGNRFGFTGQEYDNTTGDYNFHYRKYSPVTGSFDQRDPIGYNDGASMYQYVHDNPANRLDVLGLKDCPPENKVVEGVSTGSTVTSVATIVTLITTKVLHYKNVITDGTAKGLEYTVNSTRAQFARPLAIVAGVGELYSGWNTLNAAQKADIESDITLNVYDIVTEGYEASEYAIHTGIPTLTGEALVTAGGETGGALIAEANPYIIGYVIANTGSKMVFGKNIAEDVEYTVTDPVMRGYDALYNDWEDLQMHNQMVDAGKFQQWRDARQRMEQREQQWKLTHTNNVQVVKTDCPPNGNNGGTQKKNPNPNNPGTPGNTTVINSHDPNIIIGPDGVGTPKWVSINNQLPYTILYQNSAAASAPAKLVRINYPIDPKQDPGSFSLGSFGFNSLTFTVPANTASYYQRLDARDSLNLFVDVTAGLDVINKQAFWTFQAIDPVTQLPPTNPSVGFLLLPDSSKPTSGHGFVNFSFKPVSTAHTGDTIHAAASIVFDSNDTIPTNFVKNTIDAVAPTTTMKPLPATSNNTAIPLSWSGSDDPHGSGLQSYTLYVGENGGNYTILKSGITRTDTIIKVTANNTYTFFVLGTDSAGNTEALRPGAEVTTFVNQNALAITWLYFTATKQDNNALLNWATASEVNSQLFDIERSTDGKNFNQIGTVDAAGNSTGESKYSYTDVNINLLNAPTIYYRLKQVNKNGEFVYSNVEIVTVPLNTIATPTIKVYPNPFKQTLNLMIAGITEVASDDVAEIYTIDGKLVYQHKMGQRLLNDFVTLNDIPQLRTGIYILKLMLDKKIYTYKIVEQ